MANNKPILPDFSCPVVPQVKAGYSTSEQSTLNVTRKDKFRLVMDVPDMLRPLLEENLKSCNRGGNLDRLQLSIWGFVVPELQVNKIDVGYSGQVLKYSGISRPVLPPININFTIDNSFNNYYILYKWLDIQNDDENSQFDYKQINANSTGKIKDYSSTFTVYALDEYESPVAKWEFFDAFPTVLGGINASYRESAELESNFTFESSYIKMSLI